MLPYSNHRVFAVVQHQEVSGAEVVSNAGEYGMIDLGAFTIQDNHLSAIASFTSELDGVMGHDLVVEVELDKIVYILNRYI